MTDKRFSRPVLCLALIAAFVSAIPSDHADPMSTINPFKPQDDPVANITDLHAFVVDKDRKPVIGDDRLREGDQLIVSLCVRRRLLPRQIPSIAADVPKYSFRVHLDLDPAVRVFAAAKTRDGNDYEATIRALGKQIDDARTQRDAARGALPKGGDPSPELARAEADLARASRARGTLIAQHQQDESMQALYGGIIERPDAIAEDAVLDFHLRFDSDEENSEVQLASARVEGIGGPVNEVAESRKSLDGSREIVKARPWKSGEINVQCGIFDDPFIFPRFFRANVVGIVASIPLKLLRGPDGTPAANGLILLWATTHKPDGKQSDHVGRSLRTQLPRFGYLNNLHPSKHLAEIIRVHDRPTLMEDVFTTFIPPLEAHRHYDNAPDVMVYDLRRPARFPNGRWFEDDVANALANAGETLLFELSYAESRQFPRATTNDKPFRAGFPYLAPRWTTQEVAEHAQPGTTFGDFAVPDAPDSGALSLPDLSPGVWGSIWWGFALGLLAVGVLAFVAAYPIAHGIKEKAIAAGIVAGLVILGFLLISPLTATALKATDPGFAEQPQQRLFHALAGAAWLALLGLVTIYVFGLRSGRRYAAQAGATYDAARKEMPRAAARPAATAS